MFFYLTILVLLSCSKTDEPENQTPLFIGKWQLAGTFYPNSASETNWNLIGNGYIIDIKADGTFTSTLSADCKTGKYSKSAANEILFTYDCSSGLTEHIGFKITDLSANEIIVKPTHLVCIEGCAEKFKKIN